MEDTKNFSIFILEDDTTQANALKKYIEDYSSDVTIVITDNATDAKKIISENSSFRAYLLDISTDKKNINTDGLTIAKFINRQTSNNSPIIFITAFPEHIYHAVNDIHCIAYLLKPYTKEDLYRQLDNIFNTERDMVIKTLDNIYIKLNYDDIYYLESHGRYIVLHTLQGKITTRQYRLKELLELFPAYFEQCHKSYIINTRYIKLVNPHEHIIVMKEINDKVPYKRDYNIKR